MKSKKIVALAAILTIFGFNSAKAQGLGDLLGGLGDGLGGTVSNIIEGVFASSNITIADMAGEWKSAGPAVCFQSDNFLQQAGGMAAATAVESKLEPYYKKYGLNDAELKVQTDGTFTLTCKGLRLSGTITQAQGAQAGVFDFNFTLMGQKIAGITTYVQKSISTMDVMFDATKLQKLVSVVGQVSGISIVQTVSSLLDSYDGLCVGFTFNCVASYNNNSNSQGSGLNILNNILGGSSNNSGSSNSNGSNSGSSNSGSSILKGGSISNPQQNQKQESNSEGAVSTGVNLLKGLLNQGGK